MKIYHQDVLIYATLYVRADSKENAATKAKAFCEGDPFIEVSGPKISGRRFGDPRLPEVSLSPAMTLAEPIGDIAEGEMS